ncbi:MAG: hypothetical protein LBT66_03725 [Methanobrevibacter sp.]|jgi:hypothetical protein|nr:hypothetical protein [Candidatus Methanovirga meridionalis]
MVTISKKEYIIYRQIKTLSLEYGNKIPLSIIKMELELYKEYLENVLNLLTNKGIILHEDNSIRLNKMDEEIITEDKAENINEIAIEDNQANEDHEKLAIEDNQTNEDYEKLAIEDNQTQVKEEAKSLKLNKKERKSLEIIENLVKDDKTVSKYLLEGNLLYGELKLTNFSMYHVVLSLENNGIIKTIKKIDGDYYKLLI